MVTDYADYYSDLELTPGASPEEVKRAYFRLVHQYTPEKNPEEFKRIRLAYNALKDGTPQMEETSFPRPEDPLLQLPLQQAFRMAEHKDYEGASSAFAGILDVIPDNPFALMHLAQCQSYAGHPQ